MRSMLPTACIAMLACSCYAQVDSSDLDAVHTNIVAFVFGEPIPTQDKDLLDIQIIRPLLEKLAEENNLEPTAEELSAFNTISDEYDRQFQNKSNEDMENSLIEMKASSLTEQDPIKKESLLKSIVDTQHAIRNMEEKRENKDIEARPFRNYIAKHFIRRWKVNRFLYEKYGGRVIYHPAGGIPLDAYWNFLKEQEKSGHLQILDAEYSSYFWNSLTNDSMHSFYPDDDAIKSINTPFWESDVVPPDSNEGVEQSGPAYPPQGVGSADP